MRIGLLSRADFENVTVSNCTFRDNVKLAIDGLRIDVVPGFADNTASGNGGNGGSYAEDGGLANYGGSFLFMAYFLERFGEEMTQAVVAHPQNGIAGFDAVLSENGYPERFIDIFGE